MDVINDEQGARDRLKDMLDLTGDVDMKLEIIINLMKVQYFNGRVAAHEEIAELTKAFSPGVLSEQS